MANPTIDVSFVQEFEAGVHEAYQRKSSYFRGCVRFREGVKNQTTFQKYGSGNATQKARNGIIAPMNNLHTNVSVTVQDWYAGDFIDDLDMLRINHDEMQISMNAGAYALGRKTDDLITTALATTTSTLDEVTNGATLAWATNLMVQYGNNNVPDDGDRYAIVGWEQWGKLLSITQFANSQYVGYDDLPFKTGTQAKRWMSFMWIPWSGYTVASNLQSNLSFHRGAIALAVGSEVSSTITYEGTRASYWALNKMQMGSCLIDALGAFTHSLHT